MLCLEMEKLLSLCWLKAQNYVSGYAMLSERAGQHQAEQTQRVPKPEVGGAVQAFDGWSKPSFQRRLNLVRRGTSNDDAW